MSNERPGEQEGPDAIASRDTPRPAGRGAMTIALVLVLGSIMVSLDMTVVNVAIAHLSADFDAPLATIQWVATGYSLALGAVIPLSAWAIGRFGAKRLYLGAIGLFAAGSMLAGLAWNIESLVAFRVVQGLAGGLVMPVGMTILIRAAHPDRLGRLMSTLGLAILVGPMAGPVLGGWLIDEVSWRWMFFINLPIGVVVIALASRIFAPDGARDPRPLDVPGALLLSPGLAALIYGVTSGGEHGDFARPAVLVPLVAGGALIAAFVGRAVTARYPLLDLRPFRDRAFATATGTMSLFAVGYFGSMLLLPLYFQVVRGESATMAGLLGVPMALASGTVMQFAGRLADKVSPGRTVPVTIAVSATGFALFAHQLSADASYWGLGAALLLVGAGGGATMMPLMTAATRRMPHDQAPAASTTLNLINTTVAAVGTAVASVLLSAAMAARVPVAGEGGLQALHGLAPDARAAVAPGLAEAFQHTYVWAVAFVVLAIVPALFLPRRDDGRPGRGAGQRDEPEPRPETGTEPASGLAVSAASAETRAS
ncbi:DHA2 family efflux MFS transporter permease subunit [Actinomadura rugatobispora]|uniref:DHA2 family efflux MFS transporter permease subunit n=1 Tax=Actinomadura rugatobispora TaxID=1994 RepID=A0ABW1A0A3_9ACTN|nr:MFS transporter [Actinomadura rugatobispora]